MPYPVCVRAISPGKPRRPAMEKPAKPLEELENDLAALENSRFALNYAIANGWNGGNGCDPDAVRCWLTEKIEETEKEIASRD